MNLSPDIAAQRSIIIEPGPNGIGAEISGFDMAAELSGTEIAEIEEALVAHKVLFFRDQHITRQQHLAFARRFGRLEIHPFAERPSFHTDPTEREVIVVESKPERPVVAENWHSDLTFLEAPSLGSVLRVVQCPESGGDTLWADMGAAYAGLDDATRSFLSGLVAVHDWSPFRRRMIGEGVATEQIEALNEQFPPAEHPVVRTHPVSGEKLVFVNGNFTIRINGMKREESDSLLRKLYALAENPDYQARMCWRPGSVAFWDNRSTQHSVTPDVQGCRRMERVSIVGDRPF